MPGALAPSSVLTPSSEARSAPSSVLVQVAMPFVTSLERTKECVTSVSHPPTSRKRPRVLICTEEEGTEDAEDEGPKAQKAQVHLRSVPS